MKAEIIAIGDELLIGQVIDTNSSYMESRLNELGIEVLQSTCIHDEQQQIISALNDALKRSEIVLITGGLGPTKDDITKQTLCTFFHTSLVEDKSVHRHIEALYKDRPTVLNALTATQWLVPKACTVIPNEVGSAPVMWFNAGTADNPKIVISMPGVPYEMQFAMEHHILPLLHSFDRQQHHIIHHTLLVCGIAESALALRIADWENALPHYMHLAYLPKDGLIRLRLTGITPASANHTRQELEDEMQQQIAALLPLVRDYLIAVEDKPLEVLLGELLIKKGLTISSAESCTGGKIAMRLNKQPGSSVFYKGSVVAYSNEVKQNVLGVSADDLMHYGAVSEPVVRAMATGCRQLLHTDYALATSGIAGPSGGSAEKPVGTVWFALATPEQTISWCMQLGRLREQITDRATNHALIMAIRELNKSLPNR